MRFASPAISWPASKIVLSAPTKAAAVAALTDGLTLSPSFYFFVLPVYTLYRLRNPVYLGGGQAAANTCKSCRILHCCCARVSWQLCCLLNTRLAYLSRSRLHRWCARKHASPSVAVKAGTCETGPDMCRDGATICYQSRMYAVAARVELRDLYVL